MSFEAEAWAWGRRAGGAAAKVVLMALANHVNRADITCFGKTATLAHECEMSERNLRRALERLEGRDLVCRLATEQGGEPVANTFVLNLVGALGEEWDAVVEAARQRIEAADRTLKLRPRAPRERFVPLPKRQPAGRRRRLPGL